METLPQDLRHAIRTLRRSPGFTAVAVLTLGLGIGATTAVFAVVEGVVLRPLPYPEPARLVSLAHPVPGLNSEWVWGLSTGGYFFFRENAASLEEVGVYAVVRQTMAGPDVAEEVPVAFTSTTLFEVLGARPAVGRLLVAEDSRTRASPPDVAVLSYEFWTSRFGAEPGVVGATIRLEGYPVEVVGVAEPGFSLPDQDAALWLPLYLDPGMYHANAHQLTAIARLAEGASIVAARADLDRLTARLPEAVPTAYGGSFMSESGFSTEVVPLRAAIVGDIDGILWIVLGAVGVVLLIACANVANLFLVRTEARRRELALQSALGASRGELARKYLTESVLLALLAGALGLLLAYGGIRLLLALSPADVPRLAGVGTGGAALAFAAAVSLVTGAVLGLIPVARSHADYAALREGSRGLTASRGRHRVRGALVVAQVALALVLLAASGLLLRTFGNVRAVETGIEAGRVLALEVSLPDAGYQGYDDVAAFHRDLATRVGGLPGVEAVGAIDVLPLGGAYDYGCNLIFVEGWNAAEQPYPCAHAPTAAPGYFETFGIPVRGRAPDWSENFGGTAGVVVSRAFAERVWPGEDPIGKGVTGNYSDQPFLRVVGVADDVRAAGLDAPPVEAVYFPPVPPEGIRLWGAPRSATLVVKSAASAPERLTGAIRAIVRELDAGVAVGNVRTMEEVIASHASISRVSFAGALLGIAAVVALLLGAVGLYGVIAYVVGQRTGEIGVRMALGARDGQVAGMVVRQSVALALAGVGLGLVAALAVVRLLESLLFGVSPTDPATLAGVSVLLVGVAVVASYLPARRAAGVDPVAALRAE